MPFLDLTRDDHAYFFGFFQTDGHLSEDSRNRGKATIEVGSVDAAVLREFSQLFPDVNSFITERTRPTNFSTSHTATTWRVHARAFREELIELGVPIGKKSTLVAPPAPPFDERGYLRGIVDGDGSVGFTGTGKPFISFVSASPALAAFFCDQVLAVTGARRTAKPNTRDSIYAPMIAMDPAATMAAWLYPPGCLALERKRAAALAVAAWRRPDGMRARPAIKRPWTAGEDAVVLAMPIRAAAQQINRTETAVNMRRWRLRQFLKVKGE